MLVVLIFLPVSLQGQRTKKSDIIRSLTTESSLIRYARFSGQTAPSKQLLATLSRQAKWDNQEPNDPSGLGIRLRFVKIDDQAKSGGSGASQYRVFAEGAPQDKVFVFTTWLVDGSQLTDPRDMYVNTQGLVMTHKPTPEEEISMKAPGDELDVQSAPGNGEPIRFVLTSRDSETSIYGTLVAHPVVSNDHECKLEVRIAQPGATSVLIIADGLPAKAKVPLVLESADAQMSEMVDTNSDGHAVIAVLTTVPGVAQGTFKASAEGGRCLPSVVMPWRAAADTAPTAPAH